MKEIDEKTTDKILEIMRIHEKYIPAFAYSRNYRYDIIQAIYSNPEYHDDWLGFIKFADEIKLTKEHWEVLEALEDKVNGKFNGLGEIIVEGMFDEGVYEVSRGSVDNHLNLKEQKEYLVDVYDEDLFREFYIKIKNILWKIMVAENKTSN